MRPNPTQPNVPESERITSQWPTRFSSIIVDKVFFYHNFIQRHSVTSGVVSVAAERSRRCYSFLRLEGMSGLAGELFDEPGESSATQTFTFLHISPLVAHLTILSFYLQKLIRANISSDRECVVIAVARSFPPKRYCLGCWQVHSGRRKPPRLPGSYEQVVV